MSPMATQVATLVGKEVRTLEGHRGAVRGLALSRDARRVYSGSEDGTVKAWDLETGVEFGALPNVGKVQSLALSVDDTRVYVGGANGSIKLWVAR